MTKPKAKPPLKLREETWGERLTRAYRTQRLATGRTYREIAEIVSTVRPTSFVAITRLETHDELPGRSDTRLLAWCAITAYGFDPADWGLTKETVPQLGVLDMKRVADLLRQSSSWFPISAAC